MRPEDLDALCDRIMELQVRRKFFIGLVNKQTNATKALVRRAIGWQWDADEAARESVNKRAQRIVETELAGKVGKVEDAGIADALSMDIAVIRAGLEPFQRARTEIEKDMVRAVKRLPVHPWQKAVHGFGEMALAIIVGEAGNLSRYDHEDKLKKRLGLAPYGGKAFSSWRREGGLTADEWTDAGYAPRRRAELHSVMEPLFRHQTVTGGIYRQAYDKRRAHTAETHPDWKPIRSHMDAMRIMTQHVVCDLRVAWGRAIAVAPSKPARRNLPSSHSLPA